MDWITILCMAIWMLLGMAYAYTWGKQDAEERFFKYHKRYPERLNDDYLDKYHRNK